MLTWNRSELRTIIDEEIGRLPEKYRRPVVLCYLEGRTHEEAARKLRCSAGSVRGRLDRARQKLKDRLTRRGVAPAAGLAALAAGAEVGIRCGAGPARRRDGRHAHPRRDGHCDHRDHFGGGARTGRRRVPRDGRGEAQGGHVLPGRCRDHPGRGHGLAHGPRRLVRSRGAGHRCESRVASRQSGRGAPGPRWRSRRIPSRFPRRGPADREATAGGRAHAGSRAESARDDDDRRCGAVRIHGPDALAEVPLGGRSQGGIRPGPGLAPESIVQ